MPMSVDKPLVIYDHRVRWVAAINMAFFVTFIWVALRFCSGFNRYILLTFCTAFCLFWIRDLVFGFRMRLLSDGRTLQWQEGKRIGSVPLAEIQRVRIGVGKPARWGDGPVLNDTHVRLKLRSGAEEALPPNIANGLRAWNWRHLKRLLAYIRTVHPVRVEIISEPGVTAEGWEDELAGVANPSWRDR